MSQPEKQLKRTGPSIDDAAFHGFAGDYCKFLRSKTESDPAAILVQLLTLFGNSIGRTAHITVEADKHYTKLFAIIVGESAKARKGVSLNQAKRIFELADPDWLRTCLKSGLSSGEGLIHHLRDENLPSPTLIETKPTNIDKRLLIEESEFGAVLRQTQRQGNTLSAFVRKAWDNGPLQTLTKHSTECASDTHISIIGHITADELTKLLNDTEMANGFANRMLFVYSRRTQLLPLGCNIDQQAIKFYAHEIKESISFGRKVGEVFLDVDARAHWERIYFDLSKERFGLLGHLLSRAEPYILRIALIFAILDRSNLIKVEHLDAAYAIVKYGESTCAYIFGDKLGYKDADAILEYLHSKPNGASRTDIVRDVFKNNRDREKIDAALDFLAHRSLVASQTTRTEGRDKTTWIITPSLN